MPLSEFEIIDRFFRNAELCFPRPGIELGIGDDAAVITVPDNKVLVMSMDVLVADVHFPANADPGLIARRALAVNLSDLAAMAAEPFCFTLGLTLTQADPHWLTQFATGLAEAAKAFNCPLVGGDTTCANTNINTSNITHTATASTNSDSNSNIGPSIAIQVQGLCEPDKVLRRNGAQAGDQLYITGTLGDAATALLHLGLNTHLGTQMRLSPGADPASATHCKARYFTPQPRLEFARCIAEFATAGIDISDGIAGDAAHLARESGLCARLNLDKLPISEQQKDCLGNDKHSYLLAACGGDDYELAITVPPAHCAAVEKVAAAMSLPLSCVGEMVKGSGIKFLGNMANELGTSLQGFQHFTQ
ncbi:MAG: thiamine-phosphate kinase [Pseudohongiellaceae bacterium]